MDFSKLTKLLDEMPKRGIPFMDLVVTKDGKEVYRHLVGNSDYENKKPLERTDLYWLYSGTKVVTCTCALQLVERGLISLDDPVYKYLPAFKNLRVRQTQGGPKPAKNVMTIEHLFTMTSGIGQDHESSREFYVAMGNPNLTTADIVSAFATVPLYFEPGTHYQYGFSHDVLAAVVEVASGMRFSEYVRKNIIEPLGMRDTGFLMSEEQKKRTAACFAYNNAKGSSVPIPNHNLFSMAPNYDSGGAGLFSCADDYIKLLTALANGGTTEDGVTILKDETVRKMGENHLCDDALVDFVNGRLHGYGWGLCGRVHINPLMSLSKSAVGEFGWDGMAGCFGMVDRENRVAAFYGMQVISCSYSYIILQPLIRNLIYEGLNS